MFANSGWRYYSFGPAVTPVPTRTPTRTPTATPTVTPTPGDVPALSLSPSELRAGKKFALGLELNEDIVLPFDFYIVAEAPDGRLYTIRLNGDISSGITRLYGNVPGFHAPFTAVIRPFTAIPASMKGRAITFYAGVLEAGKLPPVSSIDEVGPSSQYMLMFDKKTAMVE